MEATPFIRAITNAVPMKARVLVSYASEDVSAAQEISERVLEAGFGLWLDKKCLLPGQDWESEITAAVSEADIVIFLISKNSADKVSFVQRELRFAFNAADERPEGQIFLIPVRLDDTPLPARIKRWHWVSMQEAGWFSKVQFAIDTATKILNEGGSKVAITDAASVDILGLDVQPESASPGERLTLDYVIRHEGSPILVQLGASFLGDDGYEYFDVRGDRRLWLRSGTAAYRRPLRLPQEMSSGAYRLVVAVWLQKIGSEPIAAIDCGERLHVV
jgi:TIR domain-containing protein